eukprot:GHVP01023976.1.p2 GENE.GHVP01023976.1~~GHVP01023976.1.p2  ORF type:complete len:397 (-),score=66.33 GHVP01023976.1:559-1749(-)
MRDESDPTSACVRYFLGGAALGHGLSTQCLTRDSQFSHEANFEAENVSNNTDPSSETLISCVLLGMALGNIGTMDRRVSRKILEFLPHNSREDVNDSRMCEDSAILSLGFLFACSQDRNIIRFIQNRWSAAMWRFHNRCPTKHFKPGGRQDDDLVDHLALERKSLYYGIAMGLICFGSSRSLSPLRNTDLTRFLRNLSSGMVSGEKARKVRENLSRKLSFVIGKVSSPTTPKFKESCECQIGSSILIIGNDESEILHERGFVCTDHGVSMRGAAVALGLILFGDKTSYILPPTCEQPSLQLFSVLSMALSDWDSVNSSSQWVQGIVEKHLCRNSFPTTWVAEFLEFPSTTERLPYSQFLRLSNILSSCCWVIGIKFAGTNSESAYSFIMKILEFFK